MKSSDRYTIDESRKKEAVEDLIKQAKNFEKIAKEVNNLAELFLQNDITCEAEWDRLLYRLDKANIRLNKIEEYFIPVPTLKNPSEGPKSSIWAMKIEEECYSFKLPLFTSQRKSRWYSGDHIGYLIEALILENINAIQKKGTWPRANIEFIHHIDIEEGGLYHRPDPDNMDVKRAIDVLQEFLIIPSDNLFYIDLSHKTVIDNDSFTEMKVSKLAAF